MRINIEYGEGQGGITLVVMRGPRPGDTAPTLAGADGGRRVGLQTTGLEHFSHLPGLRLCERELTCEGEPVGMCQSAHTHRCVGEEVKFLGEYEPVSEPECDRVPEKVHIRTHTCMRV